MPNGFDISSRKKSSRSTKSKSHKANSSFGSWIILIVITIIGSAIFNSFGKKSTDSMPSNSIKNDTLTQSTPNASTSSNKTSTPDNPTQDLDNATAKNSSSPQPTVASSTDTNQLTADKLDLTIKILNGSGKANLAADAKKKLESAGYIVAEIGTAKNSYSKTIIYYQDKNDEAKNLSQALNIDAKLDQESTLTKNYDFVIVIGKDYAN